MLSVASKFSSINNSSDNDNKLIRENKSMKLFKGNEAYYKM